MTIEQSILKPGLPLPTTVPKHLQSETNAIEVGPFGKKDGQFIGWRWPRSSNPTDIANALRRPLLKDRKPSVEQIRVFVDIVSGGRLFPAEIEESQKNLMSYLRDMPEVTLQLLSGCQATLPSARLITGDGVWYEKLDLASPVSQSATHLATEPFLGPIAYRLCWYLLEGFRRDFIYRSNAKWDDPGVRSVLSQVMPQLAKLGALERISVVFYVTNTFTWGANNSDLSRVFEPGDFRSFRTDDGLGWLNYLAMYGLDQENPFPNHLHNMLEHCTTAELLGVRASLWALSRTIVKFFAPAQYIQFAQELSAAMGVGAPIDFIPVIPVIKQFPTISNLIFHGNSSAKRKVINGTNSGKPDFVSNDLSCDLEIETETVGSIYVFVVSLLVGRLAKGDPFTFDLIYRVAATRKRHRVLSILSGIPCSKWMYKALLRSDREAMVNPISLLSRLRQLETCRRKKRIVSHLKYLSELFIRWLMLLRDDEISHDFVVGMNKFHGRMRDELFSEVIDIFAESLDVTSPSVQLRVRLVACRTFNQIDSVWNERARGPFPPPPFLDPTLGKFHPLDSDAKLTRHGREMQNCVGHMGDEIRHSWAPSRKKYLYSYRDGQFEATVEVIGDDIAGWNVGEARARDDRPLTIDECRAIKNDLAEILRI
jgi:hypothetical protein